MILLDLYPKNINRSLKPYCAISSGQEYTVCVTILSDETNQPLHNMRVWLDIELNGKNVSDSISSFTDENGQTCTIIDILPNQSGRLTVTATAMDSGGMRKISDSWDVDLDAKYSDCFDDNLIN